MSHLLSDCNFLIYFRMPCSEMTSFTTNVFGPLLESGPNTHDNAMKSVARVSALQFKSNLIFILSRKGSTSTKDVETGSGKKDESLRQRATGEECRSRQRRYGHLV